MWFSVRRTRRGLFSSALAATGGVSLLSLLAACQPAAPAPASSGSTPAGSSGAPTATPAGAAAPAQAGAAQDTPRRGGTLNVIIQTSIPASIVASTEITAGAQYTATWPIYDSILRYDANGNTLPGLATVKDIAPDGTSFTLALKQGVKFHDGTDFDAQAVEYHLQNMKLASTRFKRITGTQILDPNTITVNLSSFDATLFGNLSIVYGFVNSPTAVQKPASDTDIARVHVAGTGPFKFADFQRDQYLKVQRFDTYWDQSKPYLDAIEMRFSTDPVVSRLSFESGQVHAIQGLSPSDAQELKSKGLNVISTPANARVLVGDSANPSSPFADTRVRQAIDFAIDRQTLADTLGKGISQPVSQIVPPSTAAAFNPNLPGRPFDPDMAKKLLADAGHQGGLSTNLFASQTDSQELITAMQSYLDAVGIKTTLQIQTPARMTQLHQQGWENGLLTFAIGIDPTASYTLTAQTFLDTASAYMKSMQRPEGLQAMIDQAIASPQQADRERLMQGLVKLVFDQASINPVWTEPELLATQANVRGNAFGLIPRVTWRPAEIWLAS